MDVQKPGPDGWLCAPLPAVNDPEGDRVLRVLLDPGLDLGQPFPVRPAQVVQGRKGVHRLFG
jgi:hypothetical protein